MRRAGTGAADAQPGQADVGQAEDALRGGGDGRALAEAAGVEGNRAPVGRLASAADLDAEQEFPGGGGLWEPAASGECLPG